MPANSPGAVFEFAKDVVHGSGEDKCINCEDGEGTEAGDDTFIDDPAHCNTFNGNGADDTFVAINRPGTEEGGTCGDSVNGGEGGEVNGDTYDATHMPANSPGAVFDFVKDVVHGSGEDGCQDCENGKGTANGDDTFLDEDNSCNGFEGQGGDDLFYAGVQRPGSENDPSREGQCGDNVDLGEGDEATGDTLDYERTESNSPGVTMDLTAGTVGTPIDIGRNAENAFGSEHDDVIVGSTENNTLRGRGGNDIIEGGGGTDDIDGGPGEDTINGEQEGSIYCNLTTGERTVNGQTETGVTECEGGPSDDVLIGNDAANELHGGGGNDRIEGRGGDDRLFGEDGNDTILGGTGQDFIDGGSGSDTANGGNANDVINGGDGNDVLDGGANGADTLNGGAGDDNLTGGNGPDSLDGGPDTDDLNGGDGPDSCTTGERLTSCEST
jgi:Ca2+-binding RTX toxin-like protein